MGVACRARRICSSSTHACMSPCRSLEPSSWSLQTSSSVYPSSICTLFAISLCPLLVVPLSQVWRRQPLHPCHFHTRHKAAALRGVHRWGSHLWRCAVSGVIFFFVTGGRSGLPTPPTAATQSIIAHLAHSGPGMHAPTLVPPSPASCCVLQTRLMPSSQSAAHRVNTRQHCR